MADSDDENMFDGHVDEEEDDDDLIRVCNNVYCVREISV